ncbi:MAG: hypothetical protein M1825_000779 [Sarcosagium campestre]|nr:MAG: hypothetical protein M1825_000779 [Sarcosagium campestre]
MSPPPPRDWAPPTAYNEGPFAPRNNEGSSAVPSQQPVPQQPVPQQHQMVQQQSGQKGQQQLHSSPSFERLAYQAREHKSKMDWKQRVETLRARLAEKIEQDKAREAASQAVLSRQARPAPPDTLLHRHYQQQQRQQEEQESGPPIFIPRPVSALTQYLRPKPGQQGVPAYPPAPEQPEQPPRIYRYPSPSWGSVRMPFPGPNSREGGWTGVGHDHPAYWDRDPWSDPWYADAAVYEDRFAAAAASAARPSLRTHFPAAQYAAPSASASAFATTAAAGAAGATQDSHKRKRGDAPGGTGTGSGSGVQARTPAPALAAGGRGGPAARKRRQTSQAATTMGSGLSVGQAQAAAEEREEEEEEERGLEVEGEGD